MKITVLTLSVRSWSHSSCLTPPAPASLYIPKKALWATRRGRKKREEGEKKCAGGGGRGEGEEGGKGREERGGEGKRRRERKSGKSVLCVRSELLPALTVGSSTSCMFPLYVFVLGLVGG